CKISCSLQHRVVGSAAWCRGWAEFLVFSLCFPTIEAVCPFVCLVVKAASISQVIQSLHKLTRAVVCQGPASPQDLLPQNFHQNLRNLLSKIILENIAAWRSEVLASQISLPHLVAMDWRVDIKASSDTVSRMAVPTCLLQMKIQDDAGPHRDGPAISTVSVELSKETLDTMLDGLGRIRDQLSAVASK
uniref:COMM domain containing 9 n=1 Tax=Callorhinchus milii TaxID=7868 RepID=A0A4W3HQW5_CALMI